MKRPKRSASTPEITAVAPEPGRWPMVAIFALVLAVSLAAYYPALAGDFLWDDSGHVTNPALQSWSGLWRIWFEVGVTQQYYPLLHTAFWIEHRLWGDAPVGYHVVNLLQHAAAATLFGVLLRRLFDGNASASTGLRASDSDAVAAGLQRRRYPRAEWFAAGLFLLHPVCVESVAWICEQKNTLSLVLYLGAALAYLRFDAGRSPRAYAVATLLFVGALLTKTVTASLPAALLVVFWWQRGRLGWRREVKPLLPWFALGAGGGLFTAHFERVLIGAQGTDFTLGALERPLLAGRVFWFYLGKLAWPADLSFVYPRWHVDAAVGWQWLFLAAALGLLAGLAWWSRRTRGPLAAALVFGGSLFPVLGFVNVYPFVFSYVADHFQYLASLTVFALAGVGLSFLPRSAGTITATLLAALCGILTWNQASDYRDNVTLYEATLRKNPDAWLAHHNLATILVDRGRPDVALPHIERTLALRPDYPEALNNLGNCVTHLGRAAEAIAPLEHALRLRPRYAEAHNNLGIALMALGRNDEGLAQFTEASKINPSYAGARFNLGLALLSSGHASEAIPHFAAAVRLQPDYADAEVNWGDALLLSDRLTEAMPHYEAALKLQPESYVAHFSFGRALLRAGRYDDAISHFEQALQLNPALAEAHQQLAVALGQSGRSAEANAHLLEARRLRPGAF